VGSAVELASLLRSIAKDRGRLSKISETMRHPDAPEETVNQHVALYSRLLEHVEQPA
jgi:hypothetical protein